MSTSIPQITIMTLLLGFLQMQGTLHAAIHMYISTLFSVIAGTMAVCEISLVRQGDLFRPIENPVPSGGYEFHFQLINQGSDFQTFNIIEAEHAAPFLISVSPTSVNVPANGYKWITLHLTGITGNMDTLPVTHGLAVKVAGNSCGMLRQRVILGIEVDFITLE